jgi:uncharacterized protein involved in exopolysaccharide biosynthesis
MIAPNSSHNAIQNPLDFLRSAFRRQQTKFRLAFIGTCAVVFVGVLMMPKKYESEAKLFVRVGRESVTLDPTATTTTGQTISYYDSRESEINSVLDVLQSRIITERVVDHIGPEEILNGGSNREQAIRTLTKTVFVSHAKKSSVISIACRARSPELAQHIVDTFVSVFNEEHLRVNRTEGSHQFFADQADALQKQLIEARKQLADAKSAVGLVSLEGQRKLLQDQIAVTQQQLYQYEIHERELLAKFGERHPQVLAVRDQIKEARRILDERSEHGEQLASSTIPTHQAGEVQSLGDQSVDLNSQIALLNDHEGRISDLTNTVELLQANYKSYTERLEQARIDQALEARQISNVNVVQPATLVAQPVGPRKLFVLALGVFVALLNGIAIALACEFFRTRTVTSEITRPELAAALMH